MRKPRKGMPWVTGAMRTTSSLRSSRKTSLEKRPDGCQGRVQAGFLVRQDEKIVHIAHIPFDAETLFQEMIQFPQIQVRKILAGEIADGQALSHGASGNGMIDNVIEEGEQPGILQLAAQQGFQHGMIDALEVFAHITFEHIRQRRAKPCTRLIAACVPLPRRHA